MTPIEFALCLWAALALAGITVSATILAAGGIKERLLAARMVVFAVLAPIAVLALIAWAFVACFSLYLHRKCI